MSEKDDNLLSLPEMTPDFGFGPYEGALTFEGSYPTVIDRKRIRQENQRQREAEEAIKRKTFFALSNIAEVNVHAAKQFAKTDDGITQTKQGFKSSDSRPYMEKFNHYLRQVTAQGMLGTIKIHTAAQAREVARSPYPAPPEPPLPPPQPTSLWQRIFG